MGRQPTTDAPIPKKGMTTISKLPNEPQGRDLFQTPNYAVDLLIPFIPKTCKVIWEPACGDGKIVQRLTEHGYSVYPSDIRKSSGWVNNWIRNFITESLPPEFHFYADSPIVIVTNPPYSIKEMFIDRAMEYEVPWAMLINADYSGQQIKWIAEYGCEKIIPNRRIDYITPQGNSGGSSSSQFHSMWLTNGFKLGYTETFVDLPLAWKKERI